MALLHIEGWDKHLPTSGDNAAVMEYLGFGRVSAGLGRFGGNAMNFTSSVATTALYKMLPAGLTELWTGVASLYTPKDSVFLSEILQVLDSAAAVQGTIQVNHLTGAIEVYRGSAVTLLGSSANNVLLPNTWHFIEVRYVLSDTVGIIEVWVDGVRVINLTAQDNKATAIATMNGVRLGRLNVRHPYHYWDDWYILDTSGAVNNTRLGDFKIDTLYPNSDAAPNDGTQSTGGTHFGVVDEASANADVDYITMVNTTGQKELFGLTDLVTVPTSIMGVLVSASSRKDDAGAAVARAYLDSAGTILNGADKALLTTYSMQQLLAQVNPATGVAWTVAAINALKAGYEVRA